MSTRHVTPLYQRLTLRDTEVAEMLGISRSTWREMVRGGQTPNPLRLRGCVLWRVAELMDWVCEGCPPAVMWHWKGGKHPVI